MKKRYYEIIVVENNKERIERIGVNYGGFEGIRNCDPVGEWGLDEEVMEYVKKEIKNGEKEITFDLGAGDWVTVQAEDMKNILEEIE